jgi:hypothetical protein
MGTKYSNIAISGYNSSPPPDDASTGESNKVKWSTIKTKLPDPLNTAITSINSALVTALDQSVRAISANDTTLTSDHNRTIQIASTVTASITVSLGDATSMAAGYIVTVSNQSAVACVVDRITASNTINGVTSSVPISSLESITFIINSAVNGYIIKNARTIITQNSKSVAYTTVAADANNNILHPTADNNARTFTIDSNANVPYTVGTAITFVNQINTVTIAITSDTMTLAGAGTTGSRTLAASGIATALKVSSTGWIISGVGLT